MDLDLILQLTQLTALLLFIIFAILGLAFLNKIKKLVKDTEEKIEKAELEINVFSEKAKSILDDVKTLKPKVEYTLDKLEKIGDEGLKRLEALEETNNKVDELLVSGKNTSDTFNATGLKVNQKIDKISESAEPIKRLVDDAIGVPAKGILKFSKAISKGISAFKGKYGAGR